MPLFEPRVAPEPSREPEFVASRRWIGALLRDSCRLGDEHIEQILAYQEKHEMRFGEAAVALRLVDRRDVLEALYQQFQYTPPFAPRDGSAELATAVDRFSEQAEAFRELRSRLLLEVLREEPRSALAIVSPDVGDGKTYLAANLAVSFSQLGERTLLVDADIRTPRQHRLLGVPRSGAGLSTVLAGFSDAEELVQEVPGLPHLYLAPGGPIPPNPVELLQRPRFAQLVGRFQEEFSHVVVDTPAACRGPDARVIAARCGAALVVARRNGSRVAALQGLVGALARGPAQLAGVVMNEH